MGRIKKRFFIAASLFISGINPLWATHGEVIQLNLKPPINQSKYFKGLYLNALRSNPRQKSKSSDAKKTNYQEFSNKLDALNLPKTREELSTNKVLSIQINDIENIIRQNNPTLQIKEQQINQAKLLLKSSLSSWYPTLNLSANGLPKYFSSTNYSDSSFDTSSKQWSSSISAQIKWDLINPSRIPEISSARDSYEKTQHSYAIMLQDLKLEGLTRFYKLQSTSEEIKIANKSVDASMVGLKDAQIRFENGIGTKLEVLEASTQLARDEQFLNIKKGEYKIAQRALAELLFLKEDTTPVVESKAKIIGVWNNSLEDSILAAYATRQELDSILLDIEINNKNANIAKAASLPIVSLVNTFNSSFAKGEINMIDPKMDSNSSNYSNTIGINATWNIFDGGKSHALYKYNKSKAEESKSIFSEKRASIRKNIEADFFRLESATFNISSTYREVISAKESLRLANLRYKAGITTQREIVNNQRDLTDAEVRHILAISNYNTLIARLSRATGLKNVQLCTSSIQGSRISLNRDKESNFFPKDPIFKTLCQ